jgi:hypothetical protein
MKRGFFSFHQGMTDIVNCLPLINYYNSQYDQLTLLVRNCAKPFIDFYIQDKPNVSAIYTNTGDLDCASMSFIQANNCDRLFHGFPDSQRVDKYANSFTKFYPHTNVHFVKLFYEAYDIPYEVCVNYFDFIRNLEAEDAAYTSFIKQHGNSYSLVHSDIGDKALDINSSNLVCVNLNNQFDNIFHSIKVLQHAKELHLVDSIWATFCYLLDAKFGLLKNITINLYPFSNRGGGRCNEACYGNKNYMLEPLSLSNWNLIFR